MPEKTKDIRLVIIDPQNDFCHPKGSLFVPGADQDAGRTAAMIMRIKDKLSDIHVTLDSHHMVDIAHPIFWADTDGNPPPPFTIIEVSDVRKGKWRTRNPAYMKRATDYVMTLEANGRYPLCIWPPHCLIGSEGAQVVAPVFEALKTWEESFAIVDFVTKGSNFLTEHYSAVQADVPDPDDEGTQLNTRFVKTLQEADEILFTGQALSHCVANTIRDIADNFGDSRIGKFILLEDTTSPVPGFEDVAIDFVSEITGRGMRVAKSSEIYN
ncbi:MAG: isochorismatase family protein [Nitrospinota bacterium]|nr:isochorismatase family protein [Nitrospinota bacterium]